MERHLLLALLAPLAISGTLSAHHSFSAYYFEQQSVTVEGDVVEFEYRAPHAWVRINAADAQGRTHTYGAEWANPARLSRDGVTKDTIKPGDLVRITGSPGRNADDHVVHLKRIDRPSDGWSWRGRQRNR